MVAALIHDSGFYPWLVVVTYFFAAAACGMARTRAQPSRVRSFWLGTAVLLILLGLNKQLDLQSLLTDVVRASAKSHGWYEQRREVQGVFLAALALTTVATAFWLAVLLRAAPSSVWWAAGGILLLAAFILMRAATFHHIDAWVTMDVAGLRRGWWLELLGNGVIGGAAVSFVRQRSSRAETR